MKPTKPPITPTWNIETEEFGVWEIYSIKFSLEDAMDFASPIPLPDDRIRIVTPDNKIL